MSNYFKFFPKTTYSGRTTVDITRRTVVLDAIAADPFILLPYTVTNDDRPETIAEFYYGDANKVWLVYFANNIIDMYSQWPLSSRDFDENFKKKYAEKSGTTGFGVIAWGQNEQITDNIIYYSKKSNSTIQINPYTYENLTEAEQLEWEPLRYYEYESIVNDNKRNIFLIDSRYANKIENELRTLVNG